MLKLAMAFKRMYLKIRYDHSDESTLKLALAFMTNLYRYTLYI